VKFGFFADPDRTRYCYLRLRRLKKAIADTNVLAALSAQLEVTVESGSLPRDKLAAIERQIDRLRATASSIWHRAAAPEVLAASLFAASKRAAAGPLAELFSRAPDVAALAPPVATWLDSGGLTLFKRLPPGSAFDQVGYHKAVFSGLRVVGVSIKNDARQIDDVLESMKTFARYTQSMYLALTPAVAAEYLAACAAVTSRWDGEALARRLQPLGVGLLMIEGDAVSPAVLAKTRAIDGESLTALTAAFGARA
jgi:hypothetical protein